MFTIGAFSRLGHVSARMLRHYDRLGLLHPAHVGENGYRQYDAMQLPVLRQIETLKGYGFSLADIKELLPLPKEELARRIHARRLKAYEELAALRETLRAMEDAIIQMEGTSMAMEKYHVIVMQQPPQKVYGLRKKISIGKVHELFGELYAEMEQKGLKRAGVTQLVFLGDEFDYDCMDVEAQAEVVGEGEGVKELPAQLCVVTNHIGPYEETRYAYDAIAAWMAEHPEYEVAGPSMERYLKDEGMVLSPEELETGILFPVIEKETIK